MGTDTATHDVMDPFLRGERVYLRSLTEDDASDAYVDWLNDHETTRYLETRPGTTTIESLREFIQRLRAKNDVLFLGVFLQEGDRHIGNVKLEPIYMQHKKACIGIMIGDATCRGHGIGCEVMRMVLQYAFGPLGLHRIELGVTSDNVAAIGCYERLGFQREGVLRDATRREGEYVHNYIYGLLADEYCDR